MLFITGGLGFIGPHVAREFADQGAGVAVSQFRTNREPALIEELFGGRVKIVQLDCADADAVERTLTDPGVTSARGRPCSSKLAWLLPSDSRSEMGVLRSIRASNDHRDRQIQNTSTLAC